MTRTSALVVLAVAAACAQHASPPVSSVRVTSERAHTTSCTALGTTHGPNQLDGAPIDESPSGQRALARLVAWAAHAGANVLFVPVDDRPIYSGGRLRAEAFKCAEAQALP